MAPETDSAPMAGAAPRTKSRTFTWADPAPLSAARRRSDGLTFFRSIADGSLPQPPMYKTLDFRLVAADEGASRFECDPGDFLYNPLGTIHGGVAATLIDSAAGVAVQSTLGVGLTTATIRLTIDYARPILERTGRLTCIGRIVKPGRQVALAEADLIGEDGKLYARGTGAFMTTPLRGDVANEAPVPIGPEQSRTYDYVPPAYLAGAAPGMTAMEFLGALSAGALPPPTIASTMGMDLAEVARGEATFGIEPQAYHYNPMGTVHGGLAATLIDSSTGCAVQTMLPDGHGFTTISLNLEYLRPVTATTGRITSTARSVHAGSRLGVSEATMVDAAGKLYARGSASCLIMKF
jgi:uncharacterized protein (TIGR00369 family)